MKKTKLLWIASGLLLFANLFFNLTKLGGERFLSYISDIFPVLTSLIASIFLVGAYRSFKEFDLTKTAWLLVSIGTVLFFIAESTYAVLELGYGIDMNEQFPSVADFFWCAAYIPFYAGLMSMFLGYRNSGFPMGQTRVYTLLSVIFTITALGTIYYLLVPVINDTETELFAKVFYMFYPIADLALVIPAAILVYITSLFGKGLLSMPIKLMASGFIFFTVGDLAYSVLSWQDLYQGGSTIDLAWNAAYLSLALAGAYQKELIDTLN